MTGPSNLFLSWDCQASNERLVFCDQMAVDLDCEFGTVYDISSKCVCSETVVTSEATFDLSPMGDMMLYCSNGDSDQRQGVPVSVKGMTSHRPFALRYSPIVYTIVVLPVMHIMKSLILHKLASVTSQRVLCYLHCSFEHSSVVLHYSGHQQQCAV